MQHAKWKLSGSRWGQYYLPVASLLFLVVTRERTVLTDGGYDQLYGWPWPASSSAVACSFCYEVYVGALLLNLLCYLLAVWLGFGLWRKLGLPLQTSRAGTTAGLVVTSLCLLVFWVGNLESFWLLTNKTDYHVTSQRWLISGWH